MGLTIPASFTLKTSEGRPAAHLRPGTAARPPGLLGHPTGQLNVMLGHQALTAGFGWHHCSRPSVLSPPASHRLRLRHLHISLVALPPPTALFTASSRGSPSPPVTPSRPSPATAFSAVSTTPTQHTVTGCDVDKTLLRHLHVVAAPPHLQRVHLSTRRCCCAAIAAPESQSSMCRADVPPPTLCWRRRRRWSLGDPSLASAAAARRCRGVWRQDIPEGLRDTFWFV